MCPERLAPALDEAEHPNRRRQAGSFVLNEANNPRRKLIIFWTLTLCVAITHFVVYTSAVAMTIGLGEFGSSGVRAAVSAAVVWTLGAPIMYLLRLPPTTFGSSHWWGDDSNVILVLAGINAVVWGIAFASFWHRWRERRAGLMRRDDR